MLASEVLNHNDTLITNVKNVERTIDSCANELTCAVKSIVNPHLVVRKNETRTYGKQK